MQVNTYLKVIVMTMLLITGFSSRAEETSWSLDKAVGLPDWLRLSGEFRLRYESLDEQFRAKTNGVTASGGDQALLLRTLLHAKIDLGIIRIGAEMEDSRIELSDIGTANSSDKLTGSMVNALELLQAYIEVPVNDLFVEDSQSVLRAGRMTMNIGSRRLVARNNFRNTINSFTGVDWQWKANDSKFRAFYTLPIQRFNSGNPSDNDSKFDREHTEVRFWGLYYSQPILSSVDKTELFLFGLNEDDAEGRSTKNRDIYTFGTRFWRAAKKGELDYQLETVYQLGKSRMTKKSTQDLDHWAHFHHAEVGYSFDAPLSPRLLLQYDYASGDDDPNDGQNNRFETLYGARGFDFGFTSIYGAFARANLSSPALRLKFKPYKQVSSMIALRGFWLASTDDVWTGAKISGTDSYIGTQLQAQIRWDIMPKNIRLEGGVAHLFSGDLMAGAGKKDSTYAYSQITFKF